MASSALRLMLTVDSFGVVTNMIPGDVGGLTETNGCLVSVVSTSPGFIVVVWTGAHIKTVGTIVSGGVAEVAVNTSFFSVCSFGRWYAEAPVLGPAACTVPWARWGRVAFCAGAFVLVGLLENRTFLMGALLGE